MLLLLDIVSLIWNYFVNSIWNQLWSFAFTAQGLIFLGILLIIIFGTLQAIGKFLILIGVFLLALGILMNFGIL